MFTITHILILEGPPNYREETKPFHYNLYEVDKLPEGFTLKMSWAWGDCFLNYKDDGTIHTACTRNLFQKTKKGWKRWPYLDRKSPEQVINEHLKEKSFDD